MSSGRALSGIDGVALGIICAALLFASGARAGQPTLPQNQLSSPAEDAERMERLTRNGTRLDAGAATAWFAPDALPPEDMKLLVARLEKGIQALETFLKIPRPWQDAHQRRVEYFFDSGAFFIPHATVNRQVLVPVSRLRDGQAPILHETTHALLTPPQGRRPLAWLTEGVAAYVAKAVSAASQIPEGDTFELGAIDELDARCAAGLSSESGPTILPFIGAPGNLPALYAMQPARTVRRIFYGCSASFTKYLVERLGVEKVADVLPQDDPHKTIERLAGSKMSALRSSWIAKIGAKASP